MYEVIYDKDLFRYEIHHNNEKPSLICICWTDIMANFMCALLNGKTIKESCEERLWEETHGF